MKLLTSFQPLIPSHLSHYVPKALGASLQGAEGLSSPLKPRTRQQDNKMKNNKKNLSKMPCFLGSQTSLLCFCTSKIRKSFPLKSWWMRQPARNQQWLPEEMAWKVQPQQSGVCEVERTRKDYLSDLFILSFIQFWGNRLCLCSTCPKEVQKVSDID